MKALTKLDKEKIDFVDAELMLLEKCLRKHFIEAKHSSLKHQK